MTFTWTKYFPFYLSTCFSSEASLCSLTLKCFLQQQWMAAVCLPYADRWCQPSSQAEATPSHLTNKFGRECMTTKRTLHRQYYLITCYYFSFSHYNLMSEWGRAIETFKVMCDYLVDSYSMENNLGINWHKFACLLGTGMAENMSPPVTDWLYLRCTLRDRKQEKAGKTFDGVECS